MSITTRCRRKRSMKKIGTIIFKLVKDSKYLVAYLSSYHSKAIKVLSRARIEVAGHLPLKDGEVT